MPGIVEADAPKASSRESLVEDLAAQVIRI
jgi:hypothetical protein